MANRYKNNKAIKPSTIIKVGAGLVVFTMLLLLYLFTTIHIHNLSKQVAKLEAELKKMQDSNKSMQAHVEQLKSPKELQKKIKEYNLGLIEFTKNSGILVLNVPSEKPRELGAYAKNER